MKAPKGSIALQTHLRGKERKDPVWELRYRLPGGFGSDKVLGKAWTKRSRPQPGYLTRTQAEAEAERFLDRFSDDVPDERITFERALSDWLDHCVVERGLRGSTLSEYRRIGQRLADRKWAGKTWQERPLASFTPEDMVELRAELLASGRSSQTINQAGRVLKGVFGPTPVVAAFKRKKVVIDTRGKLQFYRPDQVALLREHASSEVDRAVYTLAAEQGLRVSEIRGLRIPNVDWASGRLHIEWAYTDKGGDAGTKSHEKRSVPMTRNTVEILKPLCEGRPEYVDGQPARLFEEHGGPLRYWDLRKRFMAAQSAAGLPELTLHKLRHTFGTQMIRHVDIFTVQKLMGHQHITTTQIYLHFSPDEKLSSIMSDIWS